MIRRGLLCHTRSSGAHAARRPARTGSGRTPLNHNDQTTACVVCSAGLIPVRQPALGPHSFRLLSVVVLAVRRPPQRAPPLIRAVLGLESGLLNGCPKLGRDLTPARLQCVTLGPLLLRPLQHRTRGTVMIPDRLPGCIKGTLQISEGFRR